MRITTNKIGRLLFAAAFIVGGAQLILDGLATILKESKK